MTIASSPGPFDGEVGGNRNRIHRITFMVSSIKTVSHLDNRSSGSVAGYAKTRSDSSDPANIHVTTRDRFITEED